MLYFREPNCIFQPLRINNLLTGSKNKQLVQEMFEEIRSGKEGRDRVLTSLYKNEKLRAGIKSVIFRMGGSEDHFNDLFTSTLMQFVKTVMQKPDLMIRHELNTYITSIARYLWLAKKKKDSKYSYKDELTTQEEEWEDGPETLVLKKEKIGLLQELLQDLGKNCKEVLMYWANGFRMKEIAKIMKYKNGDVVKKKKYQCFKALILLVENNPHLKSALR